VNYITALRYDYLPGTKYSALNNVLNKLHSKSIYFF